MRIVKAEFHRVRIPLKRRFDHAGAARSSAERIFVTLHDDQGHAGFGEMMPRPYLTGETFDEVFEQTAPAHAECLLGQSFEDHSALVAHLTSTLRAAEGRLSLIGGFEAALINLAEHALGGFDYGAILGPRRAEPAGRCVTIGLSNCQKTLRRHALEARMAKATTVKIKIGGDDDVERILLLQSFLGDIPIRLDANGVLSFEAADDLLTGLAGNVAIESLEQPFDAAAENLPDMLKALYRNHGVSIMADESICSADDVERWQNAGGYQVVNVRVGKCGGLMGSKAVIDQARRAGLKIVGGTLVGEAGVLNRYGAILLSRTPDMPYMEGLGQARWLLEGDPTTASVSHNSDDFEPLSGFTWNTNQLNRWQVDATIKTL